MSGNVLALALKTLLIVRALEVREALGASDLTVLEAQAGEAVAADGGVGATGGRAPGRGGGPGARRRRGRRWGRSWTSMVPPNAPIPMARAAESSPGPTIHSVEFGRRRQSRAYALRAAAGARASARPRRRGWRRSRSPARPRAARAAGGRCGPTDGSAGSVRAHAPAVHAPPAAAHEQRAGLPHEPDAERAALHHQPGARVQLARLVADEVAEQPERGRLRRVPRRARFGLTTFAPRLA